MGWTRTPSLCRGGSGKWRCGSAARRASSTARPETERFCSWRRASQSRQANNNLGVAPRIFATLELTCGLASQVVRRLREIDSGGSLFEQLRVPGQGAVGAEDSASRYGRVADDVAGCGGPGDQTA